MKKVLVSDYDGTLYTDEENMKKNVLKIKEFRQKGNLFIVATGRSYEDFKDKLFEYHIPYDYLILNHGAEILDGNRNIFKYYIINNNIIPFISKYLTSYHSKIRNTTVYSVLKRNVSINCQNITKIAIQLYDLKDAKNLADAINENFSQEVIAYAINGKRHILVEILSNATNKGEAINQIAMKENISKRNIYTIGDGVNDLEMLQRYNGFRINGSEEIVVNNTSKQYDSVHQLIDDIDY